jgi:hypothetical protein
VARRAFDEAKEAAKEAAKRVSKEAAKKAAMSSTSIVNGDVICCGRANCQGTQKYTGASWTHQFGKQKLKADLVRLLRKEAGGIKVGGRGRVRWLLKTT